MYKHLVFWKLKTALLVEKPELAIEVKTALETLPRFIPQIESYEVGINVGAYGAKFYEISLISVFPDEAAFQVYCQNPEHDEVVAFIQSVTEDEVIVDYEV